jgi:hypothetical protein
MAEGYTTAVELGRVVKQGTRRRSFVDVGRRVTLLARGGEVTGFDFTFDCLIACLLCLSERGGHKFVCSCAEVWAGWVWGLGSGASALLALSVSELLSASTVHSPQCVRAASSMQERVERENWPFALVKFGTVLGPFLPFALLKTAQNIPR